MGILIAFGLWVTVVLACETKLYNMKKNGVIQEIIPSQFSPDHMNVVTHIFIEGENVWNFCELIPKHSSKWIALERIKSAKKLRKILKRGNELY